MNQYPQVNSSDGSSDIFFVAHCVHAIKISASKDEIFRFLRTFKIIQSILSKASGLLLKMHACFLSEEIMDMEMEQVLAQSVITAKQEAKVRLRQKRDLATAISESLLRVSGHRTRAIVDYREVNPPPATRQRRRVVSSSDDGSSWADVPVVQGYPIIPPAA